MENTVVFHNVDGVATQKRLTDVLKAMPVDIIDLPRRVLEDFTPNEFVLKKQDAYPLVVVQSLDFDNVNFRNYRFVPVSVSGQCLVALKDGEGIPELRKCFETHSRPYAIPYTATLDSGNEAHYRFFVPNHITLICADFTNGSSKSHKRKG